MKGNSFKLIFSALVGLCGGSLIEIFTFPYLCLNTRERGKTGEPFCMRLYIVTPGEWATELWQGLYVL